jgi:hypothetical protein
LQQSSDRFRFRPGSERASAINHTIEMDELQLRATAPARSCDDRIALKRSPTPAGSASGAPAVRSGCSELESGNGGHHRRAPGVDGGDDLFGVDALQVDAGGAEVRVAELTLDLKALMRLIGLGFA